MRTNDYKAQQNALDFKKLVEREWNDRVNRVAVRRMQSEKRSKPPTIPLTKDLKKFRAFVLKNMESLSLKLMKHHRPQDWMSLAKFVISWLILFNKRRRAEVRELKVYEYLARPNWKGDGSDKMSLALSPVDSLLSQK